MTKAIATAGLSLLACGAANSALGEQDDKHLAGAGAVGVWTKADSATVFDDFSHRAAVK